MLKIIKQILNIGSLLLKNKDTTDDNLIDVKYLLNGGILRVYTQGRDNHTFRFEYASVNKTKTTKVGRVLMDRMPMDELKTGIHDAMLTKFTNTHVCYYTA